MKLNSLTIFEIYQLLRKKEISAVELTKFCLSEIENREKEISAFLWVYPDEALNQAREADLKIRKNQQSVLTGIPGAIKDNILIKGMRATAASKILENYIAPYDATVVKLLKNVGAVIVGKTNLDEFAMGSSTENSAFGPTKNPYDTSRVPGGSSGGSAAAVAAGEVFWTLGSDTGGSIRQPAGFCGVVGLKPTYGAVSRYGLIAMASSLDQIGPFGKTVLDVSIVFEEISGYDEMDSTSYPGANFKGITQDLINSKIELNNVKVGIPKEYFSDFIEKDVKDKVNEAISKIEKFGCRILEISLPHTKYALSCYYIIQPAEVSANLARYDGIKYGISKVKGSDFEIRNLEDFYSSVRGEGFGKEVKRRILLGTFVLSAGYYDAYYAKAQKVRRLIREDFLKALNQVDVIIAPTSPTLPFKFGERTTDPVLMYLSDIYTVSINLAGLPALAMPCGWVRVEEKNLPVGMQIIGKHFDERKILKIGHKIEEILKS